MHNDGIRKPGEIKYMNLCLWYAAAQVASRKDEDNSTTVAARRRVGWADARCATIDPACRLTSPAMITGYHTPINSRDAIATRGDLPSAWQARKRRQEY